MNAGFIVALVATAVLIAVAGVGKYVTHFQIAERIAARREARRIENASANDAFNDPMLRALISCPACGTAGEFDVVGKKQCKCRKCGHLWDAG